MNSSNNSNLFTQPEQNQTTHAFTPQYQAGQGQQAQQTQPQQPQQQWGQVPNQQTQYQQPGQMPNHQPTPMMPQQQGQQIPQQMAPQVVQIPEYSDEQKQMQQKIKADVFGLIKQRGSFRFGILIQMLATIMLLILVTISFLELSLTGGVSGTDIKRFLTTEVYILNIIYFIIIVCGIIALIYTILLMSKVRKIRVDTVSRYDKLLKVEAIFTALLISGFFFMSSFWLMTSLTTYWIVFIFHAIVVGLAMFFTYKMISKAEVIARIAEKNQLKFDDKPVAESVYYQPIGYRSVVHNPQQPGMPTPMAQPQGVQMAQPGQVMPQPTPSVAPMQQAPQQQAPQQPVNRI